VPAKNLPDDILPSGAGDSDGVGAFPAATVIVLREPFEILMLRRHERSSFVPNAWVFPGGAADDSDYEISRAGSDPSLLGAMRVTAIRELFEETGLWLGPRLNDAEVKRRHLLNGGASFRAIVDEAPVDLACLVWTSRWITPRGLPKRFDTFFFLARAPEGAIPTLENDEAVELIWISPTAALERHAARQFEMVFPTIRNLEALVGFSSIADLIESRLGAEIAAIEPVIVADGQSKRIVLP
jgi:recombination protein RecT